MKNSFRLRELYNWNRLPSGGAAALKVRGVQTMNV